MFAFYLFQLNPAQFFGNQPLERYPAALSLLFLALAAFIAILLLLFVLFNRRRKSALAGEAAQNLPEEVRKRLGVTAANRALWIFRVAFIVLAFTIFGFHVYWALYAAQNDARFQVLSKRDIRVKRVGVTNLRGWILDRSGDLSSAFAYWKVEKQKDDKGREDEKLVRQFAMDKEMSHLLGTSFGTLGLEESLFKRKAGEDPTPQSLEVVANTQSKKDEARDVRLTIDRELQKFAFEQLKDKRGAVVVLNPQNGEVLAVASNPTFSLNDVRTLDRYRELSENTRDKPLVSRAMREYYVPGSTYKLFTMIGAFRAGKQDALFTSTPGGYVPYRNSRSITDANGGCENGVCGDLDIGLAFELSSNQYFSRMAVELERNRLRETAALFGVDAVDEPEDATTVGFLPDIWNASTDEVKDAIAPRESAMVLGKKISLYDLAIQGMGQGYAGQMTPFQMALVAAVPGNNEGRLMKPKIEMERAPEVYNQILSPQQVQNIRQIMARVTEGGHGTAKSIPGIVGPGLRVGGKTGTAQKQVPVYDKNGKVRTITVKRRDRKTGKTIEVKKTVLEKRVDGWFICIAPLENPQVAMAVIVENIGVRSSGGATAAPIAGKMIVKARELGLLGENYRTRPAQTNTPNRPARRTR